MTVQYLALSHRQCQSWHRSIPAVVRIVGSLGSSVGVLGEIVATSTNAAVQGECDGGEDDGAEREMNFYFLFLYNLNYF